MKARAAVALVLLAAAFAAAQDDAWKRIAAPLALAFPRDHGAHPEYRTEWWYWSGIVSDDDGRAFGVQVTFFRRGIAAPPALPGASALRARQALAAHLAVAEISARRMRHAERVRRTGAGLADAAVGDLDLVLDDWSARRRADDTVTLAAADREQAIAVALELIPERPLVRHGDGGVSRKGEEAGNASAYVSWTRLAARGTLTLDGRVHRVRGETWFDHEWGSSQLGAGVVGWDWFGLRLADGRDLMLYRLRRGDGSTAPASSATLVGRDGRVRTLSAEAVTVGVRAWWKSPRTGAKYPARWRLAIPSTGLELEVEPQLPDAEIDATRSAGTIYWEGPVRVTGTTTGEGYAELTGYATSLARRF